MKVPIMLFLFALGMFSLFIPVSQANEGPIRERSIVGHTLPAVSSDGVSAISQFGWPPYTLSSMIHTGGVYKSEWPVLNSTIHAGVISQHEWPPEISSASLFGEMPFVYSYTFAVSNIKISASPHSGASSPYSLVEDGKYAEVVEHILLA